MLQQPCQAVHCSRVQPLQAVAWGPCRPCLTASGNKDSPAADCGRTGGWRSVLQGRAVCVLTFAGWAPLRQRRWQKPGGDHLTGLVSPLLQG